ncbi:MAG: HlyD family efflux transporter periplasmic adaptor subunit [bacterium]|nr:HlyD family efflux transporter periplasmic adaptor subunit [bacterium]
MKRFIIIIAVLAVLGTVTYFVGTKRAEEASVLSGVFENQPTLVSSRVEGRIKAITVQEGDAVKKGDKLAELDPGPLLSELKALEEKQKEAEARLRDVKAGTRPEDIEKQKAAVKEAESVLERLQNGSRPQEIAYAKASYDEAVAAYNKANAGPREEEIARAREELKSAQAHLDFAASEDARYSSLYEGGAVSRQIYENMHEQHLRAQASEKKAQELVLELERGTRAEDIEAARARMESARQQLSLVSEGSRREDIEAAQAKLKQAQATLDRLILGARPEEIIAASNAAKAAAHNTQALRDKISEYIVLAPIDGIVEIKLCAAGDLIAAGTPVLRMSDPGDIWAKVYIPEDQLSLVKPGDKAVLKIDGIAEKLAGVVENVAVTGEFTPINLQTTEERGRQVFAVKLRLAEPDARVKAGMCVTVKEMGGWHE